MRILFTTQPAYGHFRPLLPLIGALRDDGHEIRVATSRAFAPVVREEGLQAEAMGLDWIESDKSTIPSELRAPPEVDSLEAFFAHQFVRMTAEHLARDLLKSADEWTPELVVRETTEFGGRLAAEALGIPTAALQVGSPSLMTPVVLDATGVALDEVRRRLGLRPDPDRTRLTTEQTVCFAPPALHDPVAPLPNAFDSFYPGLTPAAAGVPGNIQDLAAERPLVYATLGTVFNHPGFELPFFPSVIEGLRDEPVGVVLTVGPNVDPAWLGPLPTSILAMRYLPQRALLDLCSVVICHGGYGTVLDAIDAAVPLVVVPFGADQHINAASVERLGIGTTLEEDAITATSLRAAVRKVVGRGDYLARIGTLRDEWRNLPGPRAAADLVTARVG